MRMNKIVQVVVGLVFNNQSEILMAWRGPHQTPGNCWEFPGGKIEQGETGYEALCRELSEEVGIAVESAEPWESIHYQYETHQVVLYPWHVEKYWGIPHGMEGQRIAWMQLNQLSELQLPSANYTIVDSLLQFKKKAIKM